MKIYYLLFIFLTWFNISEIELISQADIKDKIKNNTQNTWDSLRGTWRKDSFKIKDSIGNWADFEWHKGGEMYIIYDGLGGAALHSTPEGYKTYFSDKTPNKNSADSLKYLAENYTYFARCEINGDTIFHQKITHTNPNEIGEIVKRKYRLFNDTLYLTPLNFKSEAILKLVRVK